MNESKRVTESDLARRHERLLQWQRDKSREVGHRVGVSRRDLLAHGFYGAAASLLVPSFFYSKEARAADCGGGAQAAGSVPFLTFDMAGGSALHGNFLVGKPGGAKDLLAAYDLVGWNPREAGALDERFGTPMSAKYSKMFAGMIARMSPEAQARFRMGTICHFSQLDTSSNKMNIAGLVAAAGGSGATVTKGYATMPTNSGGKSDVASLFPTLTPLSVKSVDDVVGAARFGGTPLAALTTAQRAEIAAKSKELSAAQAEALRSGRGGALLKDLVGCVYDKNLEYANGGEAILDPRRDTNAQQVFGIAAGTAVSDVNAVAAGIICNAIAGRSGPGVWTLGDCDYHTGNAVKGDKQDGIMGEMMGRAVEYAHRIGKPLFFQLITDGSCGARRGTRDWTQDTNEGVMVFGYYSPTATPKYVREGQTQLGSFTDGQTVDRGTVVGNNARSAALAAFANYCNIAGKMSAFDQLAPNSFAPDVLRSLLVFEGQGT